jgi:DNA-binding transcriptional LysR family regulator
MQRAAPDISLRAEISFEPDLMQGLVEGRIDIGVMYTPQSRPGLKVETLFEERLILVSSDPAAAPEPGPGYVYVDWGPEFYARHSASFPNFIGPALSANIGWLGQQHVLAHGGSGYFPLRLVRPHLDSGRLVRLKGAPVFTLPAYAVYPADAEPAPLQTALAAMRQLAASIFAPSA